MEDAFQHDAAKDDELVLVDLLDQPVGTTSKERAHKEGLLHRAFSVMLWRAGAKGPELLLSRRAQGKYHSAGLWANSCCSHPRVGEDLTDAARRRVAEELGAKVQEVREVGAFAYRAPFANDVTEYEFDHVFVAAYDGELRPDPAEASEVRWVPAPQVMQELLGQPQAFCAWVPNVVALVLASVGTVATQRSWPPAQD